MKKFSLVIALFLLLVGCSHDENAILFKTATADKVVRMTADDNSPSCIVHLSMHYAAADNGDKAAAINNALQKRVLDMQGLPMQQAVDSFANAYTRAYRKNFLPLYNEDRADSTKRPWYEYRYNVTTDTQQGRGGIVVYHIHLDYYEGGAHGISQHLTMNFEPDRGQLLSLSDVFAPGYETELSALLLKALEEKTGTRDLDGLHDKGYLIAMDMFPSENVVIASDGITFIYNPYEIAPYALGCTELTLSYGELKPLLSKSFQ